MTGHDFSVSVDPSSPLRSAAWMLLIPPLLALTTPAYSQQCTAGSSVNDPIYVRVSHSTRGTNTNKGPSWPSLFSYKALSERSAVSTDFYGGIRMYNNNFFPADVATSCCVERQVDITYTQTPTTTAVHQGTVGSFPDTKDFDFRYYCCGDPPSATLINVQPPTGSSGHFSIMKNSGVGYGQGSGCNCPPTSYPDSCLGLLMLDMSASHSLDKTWEPPQEFGVQYQTAIEAAGSPLPPRFFAIADKDIGPVWIIQDSCECASLFVYPSPLPSYDLSIAGRPCVQLSPDFSEVGGHPTIAGCLEQEYYGAGPAPLGASLPAYILQNSPCAASEVLLESSYMQVLLGFIDRNASLGSEIRGDFYGGLGSFDEVEVLLRVENQNNWKVTPPAGCPAGPATYLNYAKAGKATTPGRDFYLEQLLPDPGAACGVSSSTFTWTLVEPDQIGTDWIYRLHFKGDQGVPTTAFLTKLLGLRIVGVNDLVAEGPEIAHLELLSATLLSSGATVNLGWSSAFRAVFLDGQDP